MNIKRESNSDPSHVVVAACPSYAAGDISTALAEIMKALGGLEALIKPGQTILVKPNLFSPHAPEDAVTTHPELVRQIVIQCIEAGAGRVWVGDSPVSMKDEPGLWSQTGMTAAIAGTPAELKSWQVRQTPVVAGNDILAVPEWYSQVDTVISLPKLKTHCLTMMTCGIKNVYGIVAGKAKAQFHIKYPSPLTMSAFLVRVFAALKPQLTIADAVTAMEGNGPAHGSPLHVGVLMASCDSVALDTIGCMPLGIQASSVPMIRLAAESRLGEMDESRITCMGSGLAVLRAARMKPSLSRYLRLVPEWAFGARLHLMRMRPKIRERLCLRCGMCAEACPKEAIKDHADTGYPMIDKAKCIDCFCCLESCPQSAIAVQYTLGKFISITKDKRKTESQS